MQKVKNIKMNFNDGNKITKSPQPISNFFFLDSDIVVLFSYRDSNLILFRVPTNP